MREELSAVEAEIKKVDETVDRYLTAFEKETMPEALCGKRLNELTERSRELRLRKEELVEAAEERTVKPPSVAEIKALRERVVDVFAKGDPKAKKAMLQALVHEIRIGDLAYPTYRLLPSPEAIRSEGDAVRMLVDLCPQREPDESRVTTFLWHFQPNTPYSRTLMLTLNT